MEGFIPSLIPFFRKFAIESILITIAFILTVISLSLYVYNSDSAKKEEPLTVEHDSTNRKSNTIMVEVSGAVNKAGIFEITPGARLKDAIFLANGISEEADKSFFTRNFNLSRYLTDQEKIHVPTFQEVSDGIFSERNKLIDYTSPQSIPSYQHANDSLETVNINTATADEIDALPGIGQSTTQKIIQGRPYASQDELLIKKVLNKNVFEQIKGLISL